MLNLIVPFLIFWGAGEDRLGKALLSTLWQTWPEGNPLAPVQLNLYAAQKHTPDSNGRCHAPTLP